MRLVITDTGQIWNHDNPHLEKYKGTVLVVCVNGKKVSDKYECFVSPYKAVSMGMDNFGVEDQRFKALASVGGDVDIFDRICDIFSIVILTEKIKFGKI